MNGKCFREASLLVEEGLKLFEEGLSRGQKEQIKREMHREYIRNKEAKFLERSHTFISFVNLIFGMLVLSILLIGSGWLLFSAITF